jgi:hypothetical protein
MSTLNQNYVANKTVSRHLYASDRVSVWYILLVYVIHIFIFSPNFANDEVYTQYNFLW